MKRIIIVVSASEMKAVRKAVFIAGASRLVISPVPQRTCVIELGDWYCGTSVAKCENHVQLEVTSANNRSDAIISAILATAHAAKIEHISTGSALP